jgi:hypothetical protein
MPKKKQPAKPVSERRADPLAQLHAYRRRLAAQFHYDDARLIEYVMSGPLPPGASVLYIKSPQKP